MIARGNEAEPLVAYVYGENPPDFSAIAAMGFEIVCLDTRAVWYTVTMLDEARRHGLVPVAHPMSFAPSRKRFQSGDTPRRSLSGSQ